MLTALMELCFVWGCSQVLSSIFSTTQAVISEGDNMLSAARILVVKTEENESYFNSKCCLRGHWRTESVESAFLRQVIIVYLADQSILWNICLLKRVDTIQWKYQQALFKWIHNSSSGTRGTKLKTLETIIVSLRAITSLHVTQPTCTSLPLLKDYHRRGSYVRFVLNVGRKNFSLQNTL